MAILKPEERKLPASKTAAASPKVEKSRHGPRPHGYRRHDAVRETFEAFVVAFILAFLFRTFEAEAFVIPTGSMAPTLFGRNKDVVCAGCGYKYQVGASWELHEETGYLLPNQRLNTAVCPNCMYEMPEDVALDLPVFTGDRILVNKFPYAFGEPKRWDVVVFKYPEDPQTNFIKRLIGLPGETIELRQGDVYRLHEGKWEILRKDDPDKQKELQILVFDNDHPERGLHEHGWPERWGAMRELDGAPNGGSHVPGWDDDPSGWEADVDARMYHLDLDRTADGKLRWLRYRHFFPSMHDWRMASTGADLPTPKPRLITDVCGYNFASHGGVGDIRDFGLYWVGDLTINATVEVGGLANGGKSHLLFELNEGDRRYRCRFNLADGTAEMFFIQGQYEENEERPLGDGAAKTTAQTPLKGPGTYRVSFANVDDRLCLWIDDKLVKFETSTEYSPGPEGIPCLPTGGDLAPVGIAAAGADVRVSHLKLQRDIYYRGDYFPQGSFQEYTGDPNQLNQLVTRPEEWGKEYRSHLLRNDSSVDRSVYRFEMNEDEFFMMGDNSPSSKDSRLWENTRRAVHRYAVPRKALVGKAFFIYWPHGVPFMNDGKGYEADIPWLNRFTYHMTFPRDRDRSGFDLDKGYPAIKVPFYPQVDRWKRIR